jgi:hypothetical protein
MRDPISSMPHTVRVHPDVIVQAIVAADEPHAMSGAWRVLPGLFLSDKKVAAVGSDFRKHSPVTLIINLTTSIDTMDAPGKTRVSRFRVRDSQNPTQLAKMKEYLGQAVEAAREEIAGGGTVLVHCHMGKHRSASVAAAYLIRMTGCTVEAAVRSIRFCTRGHAFDSSTLHFGDILDSFHHECSRNKVDGP